MGRPGFADLSAATAAAAHTVLSALFPDQVSRFDARRAADEASLAKSPGAPGGASLGETVAAAVLHARADDGARPLEVVPAGASGRLSATDRPGST